jgi:hypothetical protein
VPEIDDREVQLSRINRVGEWPLWPLLPMKRWVEGEGYQEGLIAANNKPVVFRANIFALQKGMLSEALAPFDKIEYDSFEALVDDGWRVD